MLGMRSSRIMRRCTLVASLAWMSATWSEEALAQVDQPYDYFRSLTSTELNTFQLRLRYLGPQLGLPWSALLHATGEPASEEAFQGEELSDGGFRSASISTAQISALVSSIGSLERVTTQDLGGRPYVTLSMAVRLPAVHTFHTEVSKGDATLLFAVMRPILAESRDAFRLVEDFSCMIGLLGQGRPEDVTGSVSVRFSGVRRESSSGKFVGVAKIKNTGGSSIAGPVSLVLLGLPYEVKLLNASGLTCGIPPGGKPYVNAPTDASLLDPGEEVEVTLEFGNEYLIPLGQCRCENDPEEYCGTAPGGLSCEGSDRCICTPSAQVLAGPGSR
jgi:hypothetical protein